MKKVRWLSVLLVLLLWSQVAVGGDAGSPTTYNVTITAANTEYSQIIGPNLKQFTIQCRTAHDIRIAFETGKVATPTAPYFTVKSGTVYTENNLDGELTATTIYVGSGTAARVAEIIVWR